MRHTQILVLTALAVLLLTASCITPSSSALPTPSSQLNTPTRVPPTATPTATATHTPTPTATATPTATPTQIIITPCPTETLGGPSSQILFSAVKCDDEACDPFDGDVAPIYLINSDGSAIRAIYTGTGVINNLQLSPDGTQLAFTDNHGRGKSDVYILDLTSGQAQLVLPENSTLKSMGAQWVSDKLLLYIAKEAEPINSPSNIYLLNIQKAETQQLTDRPPGNPYIGNLAVSPDGSEILFSEYVHTPTSQKTIVYHMQIDGSGLTELMTFEDMPNAYTHWFPSGEAVIAYAKPMGSSEYAPIYTIKTDGSEIKKITTLPGGHILNLAGWSNEQAKMLFYVCSRSLHTNQLIEVQKNGDTQILTNIEIPGTQTNSSPCSFGVLSPNQQYFALSPFAPFAGNGNLYVLKISTKCCYQILSGHRVQSIAWRSKYIPSQQNY